MVTHLFGGKMKAFKIDHIGVAVKSAEEASKIFKDVLNLEVEEEVLEDRKLKVAMVMVGDSRVELLEDMDENGTISKFIEKRGEGLHHMALEVDDIYKSVERLKAEGYRIISEPAPGAGGTIVAFVHPKDVHGILLELVERRQNNGQK